MLRLGANEISALYLGADMLQKVYLGAQLVYSKSATISREVLVVWTDDGNEDVRPESVTVDLLRDGDLYDSKVLSAANMWRTRWDGLSSQHVWFISATDFPEYTQTISMVGITFVVEYYYIGDSGDPDEPPII